MKRLIKVIVFSTLVLLSACGGQGIEVSNPTPSIPTSTPKKVDSTSIYGFINMIDLNGAPVYKLVFLKDKRIALQLIEGLVIIQNYTPVSSSTNAKMASSSGDTGAIISFNPIVPGQGAVIFSLNIGEAFNLLRATVTENNELLELTSENNLGAAQKDIQGNYTPFNSGSCNHFGKKLVIQQVETQFKI